MRMVVDLNSLHHHTVQTFEFCGTLIFAQADLKFFMQKFCAYSQNSEKLIYFGVFLQIAIFAQLFDPKIIAFFAFFFAHLVQSNSFVQ